MKTKSKKATAAVIAGGVASVVLVLFGGVYAVNTLFDHEKSEQFTISEPLRKVVVASDAGNIEVVATATKRVIVRQKTHWVTGKPTSERTVSAGVLRLADGCKRGWRMFRCDTSYRIEVPRGLGVDAHTDAGDVLVRGVGGPLAMASDAGDVDATDLTGTLVKANSDAGDVHLAFAIAPSSIDAQTDAGDVDIELPRGEYALNTDTDAGDTSVSGIVRYDRSAHAVKARSAAGDVTVHARK
jgi:Putative adhesin